MAYANKTEEASGEKNGDKPISAKPSVPLVQMVLALVVALIVVLAGAGGVVFWLVRSHKIALPGVVPKVEAAATSKPADPPKLEIVTLEPLLVNLTDEGGRAYLRISMSLQIEIPPKAKDAKEKEEKPEKGKGTANEHDAAERDAALDVLGRQSSEELLAQDGKERLKVELRKEFAERVPEVKVRELLFTEFLVQR